MANSINIPAREVSVIEKHLPSVCKLEGANYGTGLLVAPNRILTCNHVIPNPETAKKVKACFMNKNAELNPHADKGGCFWTSERGYGRIFDRDHLDFTIVGIDWEKGSGDSPAPVPLPAKDAPFPKNGETLYELHYPSKERDPQFGAGQQKKIDPSTVSDDLHLYAVKYININTKEGSSGAPIFNSSGELVAIHHGLVNDPKLANIRLGILAKAVSAYLHDNSIDYTGDMAARLEKQLKEQAEENSEFSFLVRHDLTPTISLKDLYIPQEVIEPKTRKAVSVKDFFAGMKNGERRRVLILGSSGSGKTTFARNLSVKGSEIWPNCRFFFYLPLGEIESPESALQLLRKHCYSQKEFDALMEDPTVWSRAVLVLDGLDEAPINLIDPGRKHYKVWKDLLKLCPRTIILSRDEVSLAECDKCLYICGFNSEDVDCYVDKFFHKVSNPNGKKLVNDLFVRFDSLKEELASTPILLEILCVLAHKQPDRFSTDRITQTSLYAIITHWVCARFLLNPNSNLLRRSDVAGTKDSTKRRDATPSFSILEELAWFAKEEGSNTCSRGRLEDLRNPLGVEISAINRLGILRVEQESCSFFHQSFLDFFAARKLAREFQQNPEVLSQVKLNPRYFQVIKMAIGYLAHSEDSKKVEKFLQVILKPPIDWGETYAFYLLKAVLRESSPDKKIEDSSLTDECRRRLSPKLKKCLHKDITPLHQSGMPPSVIGGIAMQGLCGGYHIEDSMLMYPQQFCLLGRWVSTVRGEMLVSTEKEIKKIKKRLKCSRTLVPGDIDTVLEGLECYQYRNIASEALAMIFSKGIELSEDDFGKFKRHFTSHSSPDLCYFSLLLSLVRSQNSQGKKGIDMCYEILKNPCCLYRFELALAGLITAWEYYPTKKKEIANAMIDVLISPQTLFKKDLWAPTQTQKGSQVALKLSRFDLDNLSLDSEKLGKAYILISFYLGAPLFIEDGALYLFIGQVKRKVMDSIDENLLVKWKKELFFSNTDEKLIFIFKYS